MAIVATPHPAQEGVGNRCQPHPLHEGVVSYGQPPGKECFGNRCKPLGRLTGWLDGGLAGCPGNRPAGWLGFRPGYVLVLTVSSFRVSYGYSNGGLK